MTNANDLINETRYKVDELVSESYPNHGLTKREYFSAMRRPQEGESAITKAVAEAIMMEAAPTNFDLESIKWRAAAEEKLAVLHADALINALNKKP